MALTERAGHTERPGTQLINVPIAAGETIFDGALVAIANGGGDDGRAINWADATSASQHFFCGLARITEATGLAATEGEAKIGDIAGAERVAIDISGVIVKAVLIATVAESNIGDLVYASDENTFSLTPTAGSNPIGWVAGFVETGVADVKLFSAEAYRAHRGI